MKDSRGLSRWLSGLLVLLRVILAVCTESELLNEIEMIDTANWLGDTCHFLGDCPTTTASDV